MSLLQEQTRNKEINIKHKGFKVKFPIGMLSCFSHYLIHKLLLKLYKYRVWVEEVK